MMPLTEERAIALYNSGWWRGKTPADVVRFQLFERRLCMPFSEFHKAVEQVLERPVQVQEFGTFFTREYGILGNLREEYLRGQPAPTLREVLNIIADDRRAFPAVG